MRERLTEFLPLLLVGVVLVVFQLSRVGAPIFQVWPLQLQAETAPTPAAVEVAAPPTVAPRRPTPITRATPGPATSCTASRPRFVGGLASLKTALGPNMGDSTECEHAVDNQGDTQQKTTTGLAYYRQQLNVACFTTGWDHWALTERGLVHWTGDAVDPPNDAIAIAQ
jgi:hypothetical protein